MLDTDFVKAETVKAYFLSSEVKKKLLFKSDVIDVRSVSGGLANFVYRLFFADKTTAVLKYYTTHLAAESEVKLSPHRYFVERRALELIGKEECLKECRLSTPKVLFYDDDVYYFIMEDCGENLVTLSYFLKSDYKLPESMAKKHEGDEE